MLPLDPDPDLKRDVIYEQILLDIICSRLRAGERLDESALARRYAAGRAGVRDALSRLALEGLVERRARLGTTVASLSLIELQQVFQLRVQIEGQAAALAAANARHDEIEAIKAAYADADRVVKAADWRALVVIDRNFHQAVAAAAHNAWLERTLVTLHNSALRFWHYALPRRPLAAVTTEVRLHRQVAKAIAARDPGAAQAAMRTVLGEFPATVQGLFTDALVSVA